MILVLLGPPGSGKGTQAKRLSLEKGWPHLSTGDMLRSAISKSTKTGMEAKSFIDKGQLVPDSIVIDLISERMTAFDCKGGFILDGFPRNLHQATSLDKMLATRKLSIQRAVLFEISDQELIERLSGRRTCSGCSTMYHLQSALPKKADICDLCGMALIQRTDDQADVIRNRLKVYYQETEPLVAFYEGQKKLRKMDATKNAEEVSKQLSRILSEG